MLRIENNYRTIYEQSQFNNVCVSLTSLSRVGLSKSRDTFQQTRDAQPNRKWVASIKSFFVKILQSCLPCFFKKKDPTINALREAATRAAVALRGAQAALAANPVAAFLALTVLQAQNAAAAATTRHQAVQWNLARAEANITPLKQRLENLAAAYASWANRIAGYENPLWSHIHQELCNEVNHFQAAHSSFPPDQQAQQALEGMNQIEQEARALPDHDSFFAVWTPFREFLIEFFTYRDVRAHITAQSEAQAAQEARNEMDNTVRSAQFTLAANIEAANLQQTVINAQQAFDEATTALQGSYLCL